MHRDGQYSYPIFGRGQGSDAKCRGDSGGSLLQAHESQGNTAILDRGAAKP